MNIINIIKEFIAFRKAYISYWSVELDGHDKTILELIDKKVIDKVLNKVLSDIAKEVIESNIDRQYLLWYRHAAYQLRSYFRKYK